MIHPGLCKMIWFANKVRLSCQIDGSFGAYVFFLTLTIFCIFLHWNPHTISWLNTFQTNLKLEHGRCLKVRVKVQRGRKSCNVWDGRGWDGTVQKPLGGGFTKRAWLLQIATAAHHPFTPVLFPLLCVSVCGHSVLPKWAAPLTPPPSRPRTAVPSVRPASPQPPLPAPLCLAVALGAHISAQGSTRSPRHQPHHHQAMQATGPLPMASRLFQQASPAPMPLAWERHWTSAWLTPWTRSSCRRAPTRRLSYSTWTTASPATSRRCASWNNRTKLWPWKWSDWGAENQRVLLISMRRRWGSWGAR